MQHTCITVHFNEKEEANKCPYLVTRQYTEILYKRDMFRICITVNYKKTTNRTVFLSCTFAVFLKKLANSDMEQDSYTSIPLRTDVHT